MFPPDLLLIGQPVTPHPQINGLLGMLRYARWTTLEAIKGLSEEQLDYLCDPQANSIGSLLLHMAAIEAFYQAFAFEGREWNAVERERWQVAADLGPTARTTIHGHPLSYYQDVLGEVRSRTEVELLRRNDSWLAETAQLLGHTANRYWMWFHVAEDEINHRGQIRWLVKRLPGR